MVSTYDPENVNVVVDGFIVTGFADGTFVNVEQEEENYVSYVGAKGEVARSKNANKTGHITLTLKHTSPSNAVLNRLANSKGTFAASVIDQNDSSFTAGGPECWIEKPASIERGKEISEREWVIKVAELEIKE